MKLKLNKAFSLAEVIVSMALIVILSVAGFMACNVSVTLQDNRAQHISAWSVAYSVRDSLRSALSQRTEDASGTFDVLADFNGKFAFVAGVTDFQFKFEQCMGTGEENWQFFVNKDYVADAPLSQEDVRYGVTVSRSADSDALYSFTYLIDAVKYTMTVNIAVNADNSYALSVSAVTGSNYRLVSLSEVL